MLAATPSTRLAARLGVWSAALIALDFALYTAIFAAILLTSPLFVWTNLADYVAHWTREGQLLPNLGRFTMVLFGPLLVIALNCVHEVAPADRKLWARISAHFALAFAILVSAGYFVQMTAVNFNIAQGQLEGLDHFVQANPLSGISALLMLGWTLFLGLASLFAAPVFTGSGSAAVARWAFLVNGILCLLGGVGYVFQITVLIFLTLTLGMGAAVLVAAVAMALWFRRLPITD